MYHIPGLSLQAKHLLIQEWIALIAINLRHYVELMRF